MIKNCLIVFLFFPFTLFAQKKLLVTPNSPGTFHSIQEAFNAIPKNNKQPVSIFVAKGIYHEKLQLDSTKEFVTLTGEEKFSTVIIYDDHTGKVAPNGDTINTRSSWTFRMLANHFTAENITFENNSGFSAGQAVAVESDGDKAAFLNCRFIGFQDVLFTNSDKSHQYYQDCYIEGTTDFIFGSSAVWFERCHIHSKKDSHITAASTPKENMFGYVFHDCILTGDSSLHKVSLGRPWRPYAQVLYINCYIGAHVKAEGWSNWNNTDNYLTTRYAEYRSYGPSSDSSGRVKWSKQLTDEEIKQFTIVNVLNGWNPLRK